MNLYKHRLDNNQSDLDSKLGYMRCLEALGEWNELGGYMANEWSTLGEGDMLQIKLCIKIKNNTDLIFRKIESGTFGSCGRMGSKRL